MTGGPKVISNADNTIFKNNETATQSSYVEMCPCPAPSQSADSYMYMQTLPKRKTGKTHRHQMHQFRRKQESDEEEMGTGFSVLSQEIVTFLANFRCNGLSDSMI